MEVIRKKRLDYLNTKTLIAEQQAVEEDIVVVAKSHDQLALNDTFNDSMFRENQSEDYEMDKQGEIDTVSLTSSNSRLLLPETPLTKGETSDEELLHLQENIKARLLTKKPVLYDVSDFSSQGSNDGFSDSAQSFLLNRSDFFEDKSECDSDIKYNLYDISDVEMDATRIDASNTFFKEDAESITSKNGSTDDIENGATGYSVTRFPNNYSSRIENIRKMLQRKDPTEIENKVLHSSKDVEKIDDKGFKAPNDKDRETKRDMYKKEARMKHLREVLQINVSSELGGKSIHTEDQERHVHMKEQSNMDDSGVIRTTEYDPKMSDYVSRIKNIREILQRKVSGETVKKDTLFEENKNSGEDKKVNISNEDVFARRYSNEDITEAENKSKALLQSMLDDLDQLDRIDKEAKLMDYDSPDQSEDSQSLDDVTKDGDVRLFASNDKVNEAFVTQNEVAEDEACISIEEPANEINQLSENKHSLEDQTVASSNAKTNVSENNGNSLEDGELLEESIEETPSVPADGNHTQDSKTEDIDSDNEDPPKLDLPSLEDSLRSTSDLKRSSQDFIEAILANDVHSEPVIEVMKTDVAEQLASVSLEEILQEKEPINSQLSHVYLDDTLKDSMDMLSKLEQLESNNCTDDGLSDGSEVEMQHDQTYIEDVIFADQHDSEETKLEEKEDCQVEDLIESTDSVGKCMIKVDNEMEPFFIDEQQDGVADFVLDHIEMEDLNETDSDTSVLSSQSILRSPLRMPLLPTEDDPMDSMNFPTNDTPLCGTGYQVTTTDEKDNGNDPLVTSIFTNLDILNPDENDPKGSSLDIVDTSGPVNDKTQEIEGVSEAIYHEALYMENEALNRGLSNLDSDGSLSIDVTDGGQYSKVENASEAENLNDANYKMIDYMEENSFEKCNTGLQGSLEIDNGSQAETGKFEHGNDTEKEICYVEPSSDGTEDGEDIEEIVVSNGDSFPLLECVEGKNIEGELALDEVYQTSLEGGKDSIAEGTTIKDIEFSEYLSVDKESDGDQANEKQRTLNPDEISRTVPEVQAQVESHESFSEANYDDNVKGLNDSADELESTNSVDGQNSLVEFDDEHIFNWNESNEKSEELLELIDSSLCRESSFVNEAIIVELSHEGNAAHEEVLKLGDTGDLREEYRARADLQNLPSELLDNLPLMLSPNSTMNSVTVITTGFAFEGIDTDTESEESRSNTGLSDSEDEIEFGLDGGELIKDDENGNFINDYFYETEKEGIFSRNEVAGEEKAQEFVGLRKNSDVQIGDIEIKNEDDKRGDECGIYFENYWHERVKAEGENKLSSSHETETNEKTTDEANSEDDQSLSTVEQEDQPQTRNVDWVDSGKQNEGETSFLLEETVLPVEMENDKQNSEEILLLYEDEFSKKISENDDLKEFEELEHILETEDVISEGSDALSVLLDDPLENVIVVDTTISSTSQTGNGNDEQQVKSGQLLDNEEQIPSDQQELLDILDGILEKEECDEDNVEEIEFEMLEFPDESSSFHKQAKEDRLHSPEINAENEISERPPSEASEDCDTPETENQPQNVLLSNTEEVSKSSESTEHDKVTEPCTETVPADHPDRNMLYIIPNKKTGSNNEKIIKDKSFTRDSRCPDLLQDFNENQLPKTSVNEAKSHTDQNILFECQGKTSRSEFDVNTTSASHVSRVYFHGFYQIIPLL